MQEQLYIFLCVYLIIINLIAVIMVIVDKVNACESKWRISENALLSVSAIGGAVGMYITMHIIRHKTRKPKFMIGIPAIFIGEVLLLALVYFLFSR